MSGSLPCLVQPTALDFGDSEEVRTPMVRSGTSTTRQRLTRVCGRQDRMQTLTIFNPHDFPLDFRLLSTAPDVYTVRERAGTIRPRHKKEVVLRLRRVPLDAPRTDDKFRVEVSDINNTMVGRTVVDASAHPSRKVSFHDGGSGSDNEAAAAEPPSPSSAGVQVQRVRSVPRPPAASQQPVGPSFLVSLLPVLLGAAVVLLGFDTTDAASASRLLAAFFLGAAVVFVQMHAMRPAAGDVASSAAASRGARAR